MYIRVRTCRGLDMGVRADRALHALGVVAVVSMLLAGCSSKHPSHHLPRPAVTSPSSSPSSPTEMPAQSTAASLHFVDASHGWASAGGSIVATVDGGRTWRTQYRGTAAIVGLEAVDATHAWARTDGTLLATSDGRSWHQTASISLAADPDFVDESSGWGLKAQVGSPPDAGGQLVVSRDGGRTWAGLKPHAQSLCVSSPAVAYYASGTTVGTTSDGGVSFRETKLPPTGDTWFAKLACGTDGRAWLLLTDGVGLGNQAYVGYTTTAPGQPWRPVFQDQYMAVGMPVSSFELGTYSGPFSVTGSRDGFFVGECPNCDGYGTVSISRTYDGGRSWTQSPVPLFHAQQITQVSFVDDHHGWLVAYATQDSVVVAATVDAGRTWVIQASFAATVASPPASAPACITRTVYGWAQAPRTAELIPAPTIDPQSGPPGTPVTINATGLPPNTPMVIIALYAENDCSIVGLGDQLLGSATTDGSGDVTFSLVWPTTFRPYLGRSSFPPTRLPAGRYFIIVVPTKADDCTLHPPKTGASCTYASYDSGTAAGGPFVEAR